MSNNFGLIYTPPKDEDYIFGADNKIKKTILAPDFNWRVDLPTGEMQFHRYFDDYACVARSALNVLETIFNRLVRLKMIDENNLNWLKKNGYFDKNNKINFDDLFIAKLAKTKCNVGNTQSRVSDTIRQYGLIPQKNRKECKNCPEFYNQKIIEEEFILGKEFLRRIKLNYEVVSIRKTNDAKRALRYSPLQVIVRAWFIKNGVYYNNIHKFNHATEKFCPVDDYNYIFDTYQINGKYIKKLTKDYLFGRWAYIWYVNFNQFNNNIMKLKLYKDWRTNTVYAKGDNMGDGLYHPIASEDFILQFSNGWGDVYVENLKRKLNKKEIGATIGSYPTFLKFIINLFNK